MAAKKREFITFSKERMEQDLANFGGIPDFIIEMFKNRADPKQAKECLLYSRDLLELQPKNYAAMLYIATLYDERKDFKNAVKYYRKISKGVPMMYSVWLRQGMAELMMLDIPAGRHSLMQYGYLKQGEWFPTCLIALTYYMEDKDETCFYFLDEMLKTGKVDKPERLVWFKAFLEERQGDTKQALIHYIESMLMLGDDDAEDKAATALKIRELAEKEEDE